MRARLRVPARGRSGLVGDCRAVRPVIEVSLMVAVTVVWAAVVFVHVNGVRRPDGTPPFPSLARQSDGSISVVKVRENFDWAEFTVGGSCTPLLNGAAWPTAPGAPVRPGDRITGCGEGESFTLAHRATDTLVYQHTF